MKFNFFFQKTGIYNGINVKIDHTKSKYYCPREAL